MDVETINKQIQTEKDSYKRDKNRLQQELLTLKQRHHRNMEYLKRQKEQAINTPAQSSPVGTTTSFTQNLMKDNTKAFKAFLG